MSGRKKLGDRNSERVSHSEYVSLVANGDVQGGEEVSASWRRCLAAHLDPDNPGAPQILTGSELRLSREPLGEVIPLAQEEMDRLYGIVGAEDFVVLLCDGGGIAVNHRGNDSKAQDFRYWGIWLGGVWSEQSEGTNGIGTCITEGRPANVRRDQHFRTRNTNLSCAGVPIFGPLGKLAAVLDTSTMNPETSEQSMSLAMGATRMSARGIEERLFRAQFRHVWNIAAAPSGSSDEAVLLAVDNDQRVVGADHVARRTFDLTEEELNRGVSLATLFEYDSSVFCCRRMQDIPLYLPQKETSAGWMALMTPPVCPVAGWCSPTAAFLQLQPRIGLLSNLPIVPERSQSTGGLPPHRTKRVLEYVDAHLQDGIRLGVLAEIAQLSVPHFSRAFRCSIGIPPHAYIVQRRVERARELLWKTELSVAQIAVLTGFTDQSHLTRHFIRLTGTSPGIARRQQR